MNGQRFYQQKRIEMETELCERSLNKGSGINHNEASIKKFPTERCKSIQLLVI